MLRADHPPAALVGSLRAARSGGGSSTTLDCTVDKYITAAAVVLFVLLPLLLVGNGMIAHRLRSKHIDAWRQLGEPEEWFTASTTSASRHIFTFLDSGRFVALGDGQFTLMCRTVRLGWYLFFAVFIVTVFGGLILAVMRDAI